MALGDGFLGDIGVDGCRADADQNGEMMHVEALARRDVHRREGPQLLAHEMRMHGARRQDHRQWRAGLVDGAVGQHHMLASGPHGLLGFGGDAVERRGEIVFAVNGEGAVDDRCPVAEIGDKRIPFRNRQHRRVENEVVALLRRLVEDVAKIAETGAERHHMALAKTVDRRVGDLREILPEEMVKSAIAVRENGQRRVVAHRADGFLAAFGHRLEDQFKILHCPAGHHLAAACLERIEPRRAAAAMVRQNGLHLLRAADPFAPVLLACEL